MCQIFRNSCIQQQRRVFDSDSRFQSKKQIRKCWFQLKYSNFITFHYLSTFTILSGIINSIPRIMQISIKIHIQRFWAWQLLYCTQFYTCLLIFPFMIAIAVVSQTWTIWVLTKRRPKEVSCPEGHAASRSDLNRTREAGLQSSSCKGKANGESNLLKAQSTQVPALDLSFRITFSVVTE